MSNAKYMVHGVILKRSDDKYTISGQEFKREYCCRGWEKFEQQYRSGSVWVKVYFRSPTKKTIIKVRTLPFYFTVDFIIKTV